MANLVKTIIAAIYLIAASSLTHAALVTSNSISNPLVIDFQSLGVVSGVSGPIQIGGDVGVDVAVEASNGQNEIYINESSWGLVVNGEWSSPQTYVSTEIRDTTEGILFSFNDGPVSEVGAFMNYIVGLQPNQDLVITALDSNMNILESYNITNTADISTPGGTNQGAFRGIVRPTADIAYFQVAGEGPVVDDLTFSWSGNNPQGGAKAVPTMSTYGLALTFLGLLFVASRRLRASDKPR